MAGPLDPASLYVMSWRSVMGTTCWQGGQQDSGVRADGDTNQT
ncbi:hypothetical protein [Endozoicomonas elysicola]|nr:hypothetical protein [Endozoicomonas elysicola]